MFLVNTGAGFSSEAQHCVSWRGWRWTELWTQTEAMAGPGDYRGPRLAHCTKCVHRVYTCTVHRSHEEVISDISWCLRRLGDSKNNQEKTIRSQVSSCEDCSIMMHQDRGQTPLS